MAKRGFYAVAIGRSTGVFTTWDKCKMQVEGFAGCRYKKFSTGAEAQAFVNGFSNDSRDDVRAQPKSQSSKRLDDKSILTDKCAPSPAQKRKHDREESYSGKSGTETSVKFVRKMPARCADRLSGSAFDSKQSGLGALTAESTCGASALQGGMQYLCTDGNNDSGAASADAVHGDTMVSDTHSSSASTEWKSCDATKDRELEVFSTWKEVTKHGNHLSSSGFETLRTTALPEAFATQHAVAAENKDRFLDPRNTNTLVAFCDGSALGNGRRGCRAGYACIFPHCEEWNVTKQLVGDKVTNNRAEYMAALEAMKRANVEDSSGSRVLYIFSDSMLLIRSMTEWVDGWQKNNWKKSDGKPVQNRDLLELLVAEKGDRRVCWTHVKAHTGKKDWESKWNDVADNAARNAAVSIGEV
ncbi:unnamed protein product [Hyaloperonospora brassicae]|uniref:ribonuclease H n=1 Tax=Hyaloperonospora brassicae TaxID=162125 RepID=A0AAV0TAY3_HYABA|nr:unnamed protein product [Hyaloperonospora brassicae]